MRQCRRSEPVPVGRCVAIQPTSSSPSAYDPASTLAPMWPNYSRVRSPLLVDPKRRECRLRGRSPRRTEMPPGRRKRSSVRREAALQRSSSGPGDLPSALMRRPQGRCGGEGRRSPSGASGPTSSDRSPRNVSISRGRDDIYHEQEGSLGDTDRHATHDPAHRSPRLGCSTSQADRGESPAGSRAAIVGPLDLYTTPLHRAASTRARV